MTRFFLQTSFTPSHLMTIQQQAVDALPICDQCSPDFQAIRAAHHEIDTLLVRDNGTDAEEGLRT